MKHKNFRWHKVLLGCLGFLFIPLAYAQNVTITGMVTDAADGSPLPGVNIIEKGTNNGTITTFEGLYSISVPSEAILQFTFIGYEAQEIPVGNQTVINVKLNEETLQVDEVVVVGYGVQRKRDVTGAIAQVKNEDLISMPSQSFEVALQGKAPGIQVVQGSGLAGNGSVVRVRGTASISAGGDPLYVVDGIPITNEPFLKGNDGAMNNNPLATINPNDIESVEILKDAGSAAIYGSRGANGVIIITTKRGKKGKPQFSFSSRFGISEPTIKPDFVSKDHWLQLNQEAWENDGGTGAAPLPNFTSSQSSPMDRLNAYQDALARPATDWWDLSTQTGFKQEYNFGMRYGTEKLSTYLGVTYSDNETYIKDNTYRKFSGRLNVDYKITDWLTAIASSSLAYGKNFRVESAWTGGLGGVMSTSLPFYPVYNEDGSFFDFNTTANGKNPIFTREQKDWTSKENRTINNLSLRFSPIEDLTLTAAGGMDYMDLTDDIYQQPDLYSQKNKYALKEEKPLWVLNTTFNLLAEYQYNPDENNRFSFLGGFEYQTSKKSNRDSGKEIFIEGVSDPDAEPNNIETERFGPFKWRFVSYFLRANYVFKERYILQAIARVDGSSKFGSNNKFGFFPAVSAGWRITEEEWMESLDWVSNLKLRASFGIMGNSNIPEYEHKGTYTTPKGEGYNGVLHHEPSKLPNPDLKWETMENLDVALEYGFLNNRINGEIAFYNKVTKDALVKSVPPPSAGFSAYTDNIIKILNRGVEFNINTINLNGELKWTTNFNISHNFNKVQDLGDLTPDAINAGTNDTRIVVGKPVGTNYLVRYYGVDPEDGLPIWLDKDGFQTKEFSVDNRVTVGSVQPDAIGGLTNKFEWKGLDLNFQFIFTIGGNIYDNSGKRQLGIVTDWMMREEIGDRWRKPGDVAKYPKLTLKPDTYPGLPGEWQYNSTLFLYDASYMRLRNLTLGYTFPNTMTEKWKIKDLRLYVSGTNLLTWTKFPMEPEIARDFDNESDRNMSTNITYLTPPQEKTWTFGFSLNF